MSRKDDLYTVLSGNLSTANIDPPFAPTDRDDLRVGRPEGGLTYPCITIGAERSTPTSATQTGFTGLGTAGAPATNLLWILQVECWGGTEDDVDYPDEVASQLADAVDTVARDQALVPSGYQWMGPVSPPTENDDTTRTPPVHAHLVEVGLAEIR